MRRNIVSVVRSVGLGAILAIAFLCSLSVQSIQAQSRVTKTEITGKILGSDGKPMQKAFVALSRGYSYLRTLAVTEAEKDGSFRVTTYKTGLVLILFSGVNHQTQQVPLMIERPKKVTVNAKLFVPEYKEDLSEAVIGRTNFFKKQPDGTYVVELETTEKSFEYVIGRGFKVRGAMQGTEAGNYKLHKSGLLIFNEAIPVDGKVRIMLDPAKLPQPSGPAVVRFGKPASLDAKLYAIYANMNARNSQEFQPKPRVATPEEINKLSERIYKETKPLLQKALWLSYLDLTIYGKKPDAAMTAKALDAISPTSPLWVLSFSDLVSKAVTVANQPDKYADYVQSVMARMPSDDRIGKPVPSFTAHSFENPNVVYTNANIKAKVYLIDFWATWCGPCIGQMPYLHRAYERFHDKGFEILSYSVDSNREVVKQFRKGKNTPMPWLHAIDPQLREMNDEIAKQFEVYGIPSAFLVDANGKILARNDDLEGEGLEKFLSQVLGEPDSASRRAEQSLAADGAIACFSSNLFLRGLNADRAPQLKASVRAHRSFEDHKPVRGLL